MNLRGSVKEFKIENNSQLTRVLLRVEQKVNFKHKKEYINVFNIFLA